MASTNFITKQECLKDTNTFLSYLPITTIICRPETFTRQLRTTTVQCLVYKKLESSNRRLITCYGKNVGLVEVYISQLGPNLSNNLYCPKVLPTLLLYRHNEGFFIINQNNTVRARKTLCIAKMFNMTWSIKWGQDQWLWSLATIIMSSAIIYFLTRNALSTIGCKYSLSHLSLEQISFYLFHLH